MTQPNKTPQKRKFDKTLVADQQNDKNQDEIHVSKLEKKMSKPRKILERISGQKKMKFENISKIPPATTHQLDTQHSPAKRYENPHKNTPKNFEPS